MAAHPSQGEITPTPLIPGRRMRYRYEGVLFNPRVPQENGGHRATAKENWFGYGKRAMIRYMRNRLWADGRPGAAISVYMQDMRKLDNYTLVYQAHLQSHVNPGSVRIKVDEL